jgi:hypothetical protein
MLVSREQKRPFVENGHTAVQHPREVVESVGCVHALTMSVKELSFRRKRANWGDSFRGTVVTPGRVCSPVTIPLTRSLNPAKMGDREVDSNLRRSRPVAR